MTGGPRDQRRPSTGRGRLGRGDVECSSNQGPILRPYERRSTAVADDRTGRRALGITTRTLYLLIDDGQLARSLPRIGP